MTNILFIGNAVLMFFFIFIFQGVVQLLEVELVLYLALELVMELEVEQRLVSVDSSAYLANSNKLVYMSPTGCFVRKPVDILANLTQENRHSIGAQGTPRRRR